MIYHDPFAEQIFLRCNVSRRVDIIRHRIPFHSYLWYTALSPSVCPRHSIFPISPVQCQHTIPPITCDHIPKLQLIIHPLFSPLLSSASPSCSRARLLPRIIISPRPQRQRTEPSRRRSDIRHESDSANQHTQHIRKIVPVAQHLAFAAQVGAAVPLALQGARERRERVFRRRVACSDSECVDELQDEDAGEGSAEV